VTWHATWRATAAGAAFLGVIATSGAVPAVASGDNGPLAFTGPAGRGKTQSYVVNTDGTGERRLFAGQVESNYSPVWSPDGRWFSFNRFRQLLVAKADGSQTRLLDNEAVYEASWSPDGTRLVYTLRPDGLRGQIWIVNADGTDRRMIHEGPSAEYPHWSPRGDLIAFSERRPIPSGGGVSDNDTEIFTMDIDGGSLIQLTSNTDLSNPSHSIDAGPVWSPDGTRIVFVSGRDGQCSGAMPMCENDLHVMNADGSDLTRLPAAGLEGSPSWSPDGSSLAYVATTIVGNGYGPFRIFARNLATGAIRDVVGAETLNATVDWGARPGSMPEADLSTDLALDRDFVPVGTQQQYVATIRNDGGSPALGASVEIRFSPGATYDGLGPAGCTGAGVVRCALGDLPAGASRTVTIGTSGSTAGVHEVSAMATSITADPDFSDNRHAATVAVCTQLGTGDDDLLVGTNGDDVICGAAGNDTLRGRGGHDLLLGGAGGDRIDGGGGKDTVSYALSKKKVAADLGARRVHGEGADRLDKVENAAGSRFGDVIIGSSGRNVINGAGGRDRMFGLGGSDRLLGGAGPDLLDPGAGNDDLDGGLDDDMVDYSGSSGRVKADLTRGRASAQGADRLASVEGIRGSRFDDELTGSILGNRIVGGGGSDMVRGAGGNDRVTGGTGADELLGGDGDDRFAGGAGVDRCVQDYGRGKRSQCEES